MYDRCYEVDRCTGGHILWIDAHPDFHSPETTESGYVGGMALWNRRNAYDKISILGARSIERGELLNLSECPHASLVSDIAELDGVNHLHIDGDVLSTQVNPDPPYPVPGGMSLALLKHWVSQLHYLNNGSPALTTLSNIRGLAAYCGDRGALAFVLGLPGKLEPQGSAQGA